MDCQSTSSGNTQPPGKDPPSDPPKDNAPADDEPEMTIQHLRELRAAEIAVLQEIFHLHCHFMLELRNHYIFVYENDRDNIVRLQVLHGVWTEEVALHVTMREDLLRAEERMDAELDALAALYPD